MTCVELLPQGKCEFQDRLYNQNIALYDAFKLPYLPMHEKLFFVERPRFLSATSNVPVEQNLVHLGRFMHFS